MKNNNYRLAFAGYSACILLVLSGCLKSPDMRVENSITLIDLNQEIEQPDREVQHFDKFPTIGRFPAGIALARLTEQTVTDGEQTQERLKLQPLKGYEVTYWNELFDGTPEVREVVPIREKSFRDKYVTFPELFRAAHVGNNNLLLVFGYDNTSKADTCQVVGLLYETRSNTIVAAIRSTMTLSEAKEQVEELPKYARPKSSRDWAFYVDFLAFRGFEKNFRTCIWNLIDNDQESRELQPNPFTLSLPAVQQTQPSR